MSALEQRIKEALTPRGSRILRFSDLAPLVFGHTASEGEENSLREELDRLEALGEVVRVRGEKYALIEFTNYQAGTLAIRGERRGFLLSRERGTPDVPIAKGGLSTALDGDFVLVQLSRMPRRGPSRGREGDSPFEGKVVKVLVRKRKTVVGRIYRTDDGTFLKPFDSRIDAEIRIPGGRDLSAPEDVFVEVRLLTQPDQHRSAKAEVLEIIGFEGEPGVDVEVVARKWGIPREFPEEVLRESEAASGVLSREELAARSDFRQRVIVTIDGETARDFDDAIEAEALPGGGFKIGVHIADVSHYVREGSALDAEAFERATSVYFPDRAIPMLPERLSNDLCSLRPDEDRRTVSAILTINSQGETVNAEFCRSLIRSQARLTYTAVGALLEETPPGQRGESAGPVSAAAMGASSEQGQTLTEPRPLFEKEGEKSVPAGVIPMLRTAFAAAKILRKMRTERGSLDFDLPDADLILGETGDVVAIVKEVRNEAHRLIEEFMLAANEAVARYLESLPVPAMYRVHDPPDARRILELQTVLEPLGYEIEETDDGVEPAVFQALIDAAEGKPEERFVSDLVLRAQKKALYSQECRGHYALAAPYYCHFTSPIRRYPDLIVHRALTRANHGWRAITDRRPVSDERFEAANLMLERSSQHCSDRERRAEGAEREAAAWKKFVFLAERIGDEFTAYVSAVAPFGLFVVLQEFYADGLVPIATMSDEYYRFDEGEHQLTGTSTGKVYRLGDVVDVKLSHADHDRRTLEFALVGLKPSLRKLERPGKGPRRAGPEKRGRKPWKR